jgi:hypothetical protein
MDWIIQVTDAERAAGQLSATSDQAARAALRTFGCVLLRGVFPVETIDGLRAAFDAQLGALTAEEMAEQAKKPAPNPVLLVGEKRYEVLVKIKGAFGDPNLFGNLLLCRFLVRVLDQNLKLSGMTVVVSYPGATLQHIHSDLHPLFGEPGLSASLPHYAINVSVPLIDVDQQTGPTGIWLGSHLWPANRGPHPDEYTSVDYLRGDCILIDYRTLHAGLPNTSSSARPILYMVYARTWFFDEVNHQARPSLDMAADDFLRLPPHLQALMKRAYSQRLRAAYITKMDAPPDGAP